jgi:menaquinone-dependent protoporphyrinogen IX oxidase
MIHRLQNRIEKRLPNHSENSYKVACVVEKMLYKSSYDITEYSNLDTLDERIRAILAIQLCKRTLRTKKTSEQTATKLKGSTRSSVLIDLLGGLDRYRTVESLVYNVKKTKLELVVRMKGGCTKTSCPYPATSSSTMGKFPQNTVFPEPLRDLFFHIPLVQIFDKTPIEKLQNQDWDSLIKDAQTKYQAFLQYIHNEQQPKI